MGFLDKAKAAATDLTAKANTALSSSGAGGPSAPGAGDVDRYFRDLGVLTYLEANGRSGDPEDRARVMAALQEMEARGAIRSLALHTAPPPAPGTAGAGGFPPPPGAVAASVLPPPAGVAPAPQASPTVSAPPPPPQAVTPPPPPPSWMTKDGDGNG